MIIVFCRESVCCARGAAGHYEQVVQEVEEASNDAMSPVRMLCVLQAGTMHACTLLALHNKASAPHRSFAISAAV